MSESPRAKNWQFTWNNYPDDWKKVLRKVIKVKWCVAQPETCPTTGTPHIQGVFGFANQKRRSTLTKAFKKKVHLEPARSVAALRKYSSKAETKAGDTWTYGEVPAFRPGKETELIKIEKAVKEGKPITYLWENHFGSMLRHHKAISTAALYLNKPEDCPKAVYVFEGPPGVGKTKQVYDLYGYEKVFKVASSCRWFDGYDPALHEVVLFDDYRGSLKWAELMNITDRYPYRVEYKGSYLQWCPKIIIFTTNVPPEVWYTKKSLDPIVWNAFKRRVTKYYRWMNGTPREIPYEMDKEPIQVKYTVFGEPMQ